MEASGQGFGSTLSYDGTRIRFLTEGKGLPLVLCNGVLCSIGYWIHLRTFFKRRARVILWDYRGHGMSSPPRHLWNVTVGAHARDLLAVLDAAGVETAVLAGHSMGVQVILEFYRRHPERVAGLIPICGTYGYPLRTFYGTPWSGRVLKPMLKRGERFPEAVGRVLKPLFLSPLAVPLARLSGAVHWYLCPGEAMKVYFQHLSTLDVAVALRLVQAMVEHSAEDVLGSVAVPTLIVAGEQDPFTPVWVAEKMAAAIAGSELLVIPRGSHTALVEHPLLLNLRIELFLRDHFRHLGYDRRRGPLDEPARPRPDRGRTGRNGTLPSGGAPGAVQGARPLRPHSQAKGRQVRKREEAFPGDPATRRFP
jgi:pimeloyl-ACP methyl ester carboxylesterase